MLGFCPLTYWALTPKKGEIDEWAKPLVALTAEAEAIIGVTNEQLDHCRSSAMVMGDFTVFADF
jgi:hypothetical protein